MVDWICESPLPLAIAGVVLAMSLFLRARQRGETRLLALAFFAAALIPGGWLLDTAIETDAERVEQAVMALVTDYREKNADALRGRVSTTNPLLATAVAAASTLFNFESERVTDVVITPRETDFDAHFRLNADFYGTRLGDIGRKPTRWTTRWVLEDGEWKLKDVTRLDPITGDVLDTQSELLRRFGGAAFDAGKDFLRQLVPSRPR